MILLRCFIRLLYKIILHSEPFAKQKYLKTVFIRLNGRILLNWKTKLGFTYTYTRSKVLIFFKCTHFCVFIAGCLLKGYHS
jgi:hypothetical protein